MAKRKKKTGKGTKKARKPDPHPDRLKRLRLPLGLEDALRGAMEVPPPPRPCSKKADS